MDTIVRYDIPFAPDAEALMRQLRIDAEFEDEFRALLSECARIARPKYMLGRCGVRRAGDATYVGAEAFTSRIMAVNLEEVADVYPYAVTCGRELYELALSKDDPLERYWVDAISECALYEASARALSEVRQIAGAEAVSSMNPGSLTDFPITNQVPLFRLLGDARAAIGLELTDSCLMLPYKSVSGIYFASDEHFVSCALCQRVNCPGRRAEFDEMQFHARYALGTA